MIYLLFNEGYSTTDQSAAASLCQEAIRLGRLLLSLFRDDPEIMGMSALMLLQHARAGARFDRAGAIILLEDQDRGLWNAELIGEGFSLVEKALHHRRPGPYQIQAAIAACHARAAHPSQTDWAQIEALYAALERLQPSPVVTLNRAVAVAKIRGAGRSPGHDRTFSCAPCPTFPLLRRQGRVAGTARAKKRHGRRSNAPSPSLARPHRRPTSA
jgi:RNA polymerase sigma-70 factor, ECF subfamily